uniref:Uncharacterized protein LOC101491364 isoform X6 n=1 Tax=Cicer arietinum TaxID=3827 RepID=A0A3Q7YB92_CICAR|nr:uncharacterized protein LOC101491364 isoform X6 [Cicer arietinum]
MHTPSSLINISITWRGKKFIVDMNSDATVKDLGQELQKLTGIKEDTMKLIVPQIAGRTSKLLAPFSTEHALLSLRETSLTELNPPPSEALKRMHMLAADPGIVAVMNKHRWRVGIMTEMAPIGYVGVSPKCILGFNKNCGEEISLRLRTDDLKGFRKYESIKKTLLHELAHMIYSEHDANFYALDRQLNQEATSLDWTRSAGHTLSGVRSSEIYEEDFMEDSSNIPQKLGGNRSDQLMTARESSVIAAYHRMANVSANKPEGSEVNQELDCDYSNSNTKEKPDHMESSSKEIEFTNTPIIVDEELNEPDPDDHIKNGMKHEPDPDDSYHGKAVLFSVCSRTIDSRTVIEQNPIDFGAAEPLHPQTSTVNLAATYPDANDSETSLKSNSPAIEMNMMAEPDPDDLVIPAPELSMLQTDEPDPDDQELQRINGAMTAICNRLQKALEMLRRDVSPMQSASILQTLLKIIRNAIEHPEMEKYKRLRKANPVIERNILNNKAALEILSLVGFREDIIFDNLGKADAYLVLKRNDPGLLWLAKSTLESRRAC